MAEKIVLSLEIDGVQREIKSLGEMKKALKDSKSELLKFEVGSAGFKKAAKNVQELTDKLDGLGDVARVQGTGIEKLQASFGLMGEALTNGDLEKGKVALAGVGEAMKAIPIFLLIEGLKALIENWGAIMKFFRDFTDSGAKSFIGSLDAITTSIERQKTGVEDLLGAYEVATDKMINAAKRRGASEAELDEIRKTATKERLAELKQAEELADKQLRELQANMQKYSSKMDADEIKSANEKLAELSKARDEYFKEGLKLRLSSDLAEDNIKTERVLKEKEEQKQKDKERRDRIKKELEEAKKKAEEEAEIRRKADVASYNRMADLENAAIDAEEKRKQKAKEDKKKEDELFLQAIAEGNALDDAEAEKSAAELKDRRKKETDEEKKAAEERAALKVAAVDASFAASKNISDAYFQNQLKGAKGNAEAELKIRKKQFEVEKAFNIARAVIDGIRGVQAALIIPPPFGPILAAENAATALANVTAIANTEFDSGASINADTGAPSTGSAPTVNTVQTIQPSTRLDENGRPINVNVSPKVEVVEKEMTDKQRAMEKIRRQSKVG